MVIFLSLKDRDEIFSYQSGLYVAHDVKWVWQSLHTVGIGTDMSGWLYFY